MKVLDKIPVSRGFGVYSLRVLSFPVVKQKISQEPPEYFLSEEAARALRRMGVLANSSQVPPRIEEGEAFILVDCEEGEIKDFYEARAFSGW